MMFGTMWRKMMSGVRTPAAIAASTYGSCLTASVEARATRAKPGVKATVSTTTMFQNPPPSAAAIRMASRSSGKAISMSMPRLTIRSTVPPK